MKILIKYRNNLQFWKDGNSSVNELEPVFTSVLDSFLVYRLAGVVVPCGLVEASFNPGLHTSAVLPHAQILVQFQRILTCCRPQRRTCI